MPRRKCPSKILLILEKVADENMLLISQLGPTSWLVGDDGSSNDDELQEVHRVSLGERHFCSCPVFRVTKDICRHLGWILRKKLKFSLSDPLCYQLGVTDRELNSVLSPTRPERVRIVRKNNSDGQTRRPVLPRKYRRDDPCPICLEEFSKRNFPVVHCKFSCGQPMHGHCMQVVAKHQKDEINLICPLCRGEFSTRIELSRMIKLSQGCGAKLGLEKNSALPPLASHDIACILCNSRVVGSLFKCLNCPNVVTCSICVASEKYSIHAEHGLVVKNSPFDRWKITAVKTDQQRSKQIKRDLPRLVVPRKNTSTTKVVDDKTSAIQCPICTDQGYSVVTLECGHLVPTPEIDRPPSSPPPTHSVYKPMTRTPRGRLSRIPMTSASSSSGFRPPPPEVIVQRVELASRVNSGPISTSGQQQLHARSRSQSRRCASAYPGNKSVKKKLTESSLMMDGDKRNTSPFDPRENGRILGSKVLPIMALLLQKRADESNDDKFDSVEDAEVIQQETPHHPSAASVPGHSKASNKQRLAIQCVQLLPDAEPPLQNKPCSSRRQCRA